jgi:hypothetical protein
MRKLLGIASIFVFFVGSEAAAQVQIQQPDFFAAFERGRAARRATDQQAADMQARQQEEAEIQAALDLQKAVGRLVAAGQCQEAVNTALTGGNFNLAQQAKSMCADVAPAPVSMPRPADLPPAPTNEWGMAALCNDNTMVYRSYENACVDHKGVKLWYR